MKRKKTPRHESNRTLYIRVLMELVEESNATKDFKVDLDDMRALLETKTDAELLLLVQRKQVPS